MLKEQSLVGAIAIYSQEVRPFTDKQIELVQNFAAQAVIAIENTRLLNELRESLENQTASADILRTIASSPAQAEQALDVIAETTARRFGASNVNIRLLDGNVLRLSVQRRNVLARSPHWYAVRPDRSAPRAWCL